jgi:hypothetical protein
MVIILYGSYQPSTEKELLVELKQLLVNNGYSQTYLVDEFQDETLTSLEVSQRCLLFADVNYLIFTDKGSRRGLVRELAFIALSTDMITKIAGCVAFDEMFEEHSSIPDLSSEDINNLRMKRFEYGNRQELEQSILSESYWQLRRLASVLAKRPVYDV